LRLVTGIANWKCIFVHSLTQKLMEGDFDGDMVFAAGQAGCYQSGKGVQYSFNTQILSEKNSEGLVSLSMKFPVDSDVINEVDGKMTKGFIGILTNAERNLARLARMYHNQNIQDMINA